MTTHNSDPDHFYYMSYSQPVRTINSPVEIPLYRITTLANISSIRMIHRCIGRKGKLLADQCRVEFSNDIRSTIDAFPKNSPCGSDNWTDVKHLVKLARLCLCQDCCQTQLSDVVVAWMNEGAEDARADSVIDAEEMKSLVSGLAPVKSFVAASVATYDLFSKVCGFWS